MATSNKLLRKLRRELTGNPKKGAALAALLAVAAWYWIPLAQKFFGQNANEEAATAPANAGAASSIATALNPPAASEATTPTNINWKQVLDWIHNDPMMQPRVPAPGARDPFAPSAARRLAREQSERTAQPPPPADVTPEESGLVLRSTVIGARNRTAMINEQAYHEGQDIKSPKQNDRFKLVRIEARYVVLQSNGKQYQLKLHTAEMADVEQ